MDAKCKDLWVLLETDEAGCAKSVGLELLGAGKSLAKKQGGVLVAVIIGNNVESAISAAAAFGAERILVVDRAEYALYNTDAYTHVLTELVKKYAPESILIGATDNGRDLAPRVSCRLKTGLVADCTFLAFDETKGLIAWTRPAFGGNLMATIVCPDHRPQMGTVRPGIFKKMSAPAAKTEVIREDIPPTENFLRVQILDTINDINTGVVDLENAEIIVAGGRGTGGAEGFALIENFAAALGATVGASRAAVEAGWIPHAYQVGQTGKAVSPKVYFACGISGAVQHLAGMSGSDIIVAINKDPEANIFSVADYGIVGDLFEILPVLTEEIRRYRKDTA